jgi:hypothetical protein
MYVRTHKHREIYIYTHDIYFQHTCQYVSLSLNCLVIWAWTGPVETIKNHLNSFLIRSHRTCTSSEFQSNSWWLFRTVEWNCKVFLAYAELAQERNLLTGAAAEDTLGAFRPCGSQKGSASAGKSVVPSSVDVGGTRRNELLVDGELKSRGSSARLRNCVRTINS